VIAVGRRLAAALWCNPGLGREIVLVLIVKTLLLSLLFHGLSAGPAPRRVDRLRRAAVLPAALARSTPARRSSLR
jgi:hypothetical protein